MTLKTIQDMRSRSGVTLVELLVVILIVMILAVGLLPTFKKFVVEAQYASEPAALVGHIRTQIALYQYEKNLLPVAATTNNSAKLDRMFIYTKAATGYELKDYKIPSAKLEKAPPATGNAAAEDMYLANMDLGMTEYQGNRVAPQHVQFAVSRNATEYAYGIGVFGDGVGLPANTGYAVYEAFLPQVKVATSTDEQTGYKFVATWKNYTGKGATTDLKQIYFGTCSTAAAGMCLIPPASALAAANVEDGLASSGALRTMVSTYFDPKLCGSWSYTRLPE